MMVELSNVIKKEFGKEGRESARNLKHLLDMAEDLHAELERDPVRLFDIAQAKIASLQRSILDAQGALHIKIEPQLCDRPTEPNALSMVYVDSREYARLKRCADIVRSINP